MKMLVVDKDEVFEHLIQSIARLSKFDVLFSHSYNSAIKKYHDYEIDIVIIDFMKPFGKTTLDYITQHNPKQRIIVVSNELEHSEKISCEYCIENFNKVRLLKPVDIKMIIGILKDFDSFKCSFKEKFTSAENIMSIMDEVLKSYYNIKYDHNNHIVTFKRNSLEYMKFLDTLDNKSINYSILDDKRIKLLCK